jgi:hypothetical protein
VSIECRRVKLPAATWSSLKAAADQRGLAPARLARLLIETIVRDALFNAIIDDTPHAQRRSKFRQSGSSIPPPSSAADIKSDGRGGAELV